MSLTLKAGRMMGQQSVYDDLYPLYGLYYDIKWRVSINKQVYNDYINYYYNSGHYISYTIQPQDTLQKIIDKFYNGYYINSNRYEEIITAIVSMNQDKFGQLSSDNYAQVDLLLRSGMQINLPAKDYLRK
jgi:hypothetical protein